MCGKVGILVSRVSSGGNDITEFDSEVHGEAYKRDNDSLRSISG
jgi:hypothetical protein